MMMIMIIIIITIIIIQHPANYTLLGTILTFYLCRRRFFDIPKAYLKRPENLK